MPKVVDREARRREIVEAYLRLVARDGMEQATSRALAAELGVSSGALWHYFANVDQVLFGAFRLIFDRTNERIAERCVELEGLAALRAMLEEILPLAKVTQDEALVVVSFWGRVPTNPELGSFQAEVEGRWREQMVTHLRQAQASGHVVEAAPLAVIADTLLVLTVGQQVEHVLRSDVATEGRQWELVAACLEPWLTDAGRQP
ncbi:TetR/AcrR family transcriptional regulator [Actinotalea sp. C106]|uniref:TetR/AcrR family transcriptional regulator n=1 Tax=Actinotalea sp. C106 TaxID=2908644 RepID=UPI00202791AC|nr:TetR family transcriptional regulator C-terminal domain-containing protein [Actinotalea sp. C106]